MKIGFLAILIEGDKLILNGTYPLVPGVEINIHFYHRHKKSGEKFKKFLA
jgi:hypothetical protein